MIDNPWFYLIAVPAVLISGISKGGFGGGLGVVAVPMMALVISPIQAAAIMLPILCLMDLFGVWAYRHSWDPVNLKIMIPAAVLGILIGTASYSVMNVAFIKLLVGAIAVGFTLDYLLRSRKVAGPPRQADPLRGGFWAMIAGFTSFVAHAGGPPIGVYLLPQRLQRSLFVGTTVIFFMIVNYIKLIPYSWLGQLQGGNLLTSLALAPLAPLGIRLGVWLHYRVSDVLFYRICYSFLFITGLKLLWDALAAF